MPNNFKHVFISVHGLGYYFCQWTGHSSQLSGIPGLHSLNTKRDLRASYDNNNRKAPQLSKMLPKGDFQPRVRIPSLHQFLLLGFTRLPAQMSLRGGTFSYSEKRCPWHACARYVTAVSNCSRQKCAQSLHPKYNLCSHWTSFRLSAYPDISSLNCSMLIYSFDVFQITKAIYDWYQVKQQNVD